MLNMADLLDLQRSRYARQMRFPRHRRRRPAEAARLAGPRRRLRRAGSVIANTLARAGVGKLRIVDRDFLELNNLQRQVSTTKTTSRPACPKRSPPKIAW